MFIYSSSQQIHLYWKGEQWHAAFNHILIHILAHTLSHRLFMVIKGEEMYSRSLSLSLEENGAEETTNTAIIVILNNFIMFARCNMQFAICHCVVCGRLLAIPSKRIFPFLPGHLLAASRQLSLCYISVIVAKRTRMCIVCVRLCVSQRTFFFVGPRIWKVFSTDFCTWINKERCLTSPPPPYNSCYYNI